VDIVNDPTQLSPLSLSLVYFFSLHCLSFLLFLGSGIGLSLKNVTIPNYGVKDGTVILSCEFNLLPSDNLLFLKWYKDDEEFFRFTPSSPQPILTFPLDGVFVEVSLKRRRREAGMSLLLKANRRHPTFSFISLSLSLSLSLSPNSILPTK